MKKYILLIMGDDRFSTLSPGEVETLIDQYRAWGKHLSDSGILVDAEGLEPMQRRILAGPTVVDGPFPNSGSGVGGYYIFKAENLDAATEIAKNCPAVAFAGLVELRETSHYT